MMMDDGTDRVIEVDGTSIRFHDEGAGPPVVFVHGLLVNGALWRHVAPGVAAAGHRCLSPDWPLGAHRVPVPESQDLSPAGVADLVAGFLEVLDLRDVTLVANDTGGAITQILLTRRPERVGRVVLTPSDSFDRFFPQPFTALPLLARVPGAVTVLVHAMRWRALHRLPFVFGWVTKRPVPREVADGYLTPARENPLIRRDLARFLRGVHRQHTLAAAQRLGEFDRPVLLAWATEDKLFPFRYAHRLAAVFPRATVTPVDDSYTFVPEDQPALLTRLIVEFCATPADTRTPVPGRPHPDDEERAHRGRA